MTAVKQAACSKAAVRRHQTTSLLARNIGSILAQYFVQYWLNIVHNIGPMKDCSHEHNIGPILLVNIGPIFSAILVKYCVKYWDNVGLFTLAQYLANIAGRYWAYVGYILDPHCKLQLGASIPLGVLYKSPFFSPFPLPFIAPPLRPFFSPSSLLSFPAHPTIPSLPAVYGSLEPS